MYFAFDKKPSSNLSYIYSVCVVMTTHLSFQNVFFIEMQQITLCLACFQGVVVVTGGGGGKIIPNDGWSKWNMLDTPSLLFSVFRKWFWTIFWKCNFFLV